jgi:uncharacterized integral membrane protein (TIGR00698 family)
VTAQTNDSRLAATDALTRLAPGIAAAALVAAAGYALAPAIARVLPIPAMMLALLLGMALNPLAANGRIERGAAFCVRSVLRWSVAMLGIRIGISDVAALGLGTALLVVAAMAATIVSGFLLARWSGRSAMFGALIGVGTGVCGASATLAVSTVVPEYPGKSADIAFVVVAVNALATISMLVYPPICVLLGLDPQATGVMLGGTIHDVAQVAGAGYAVSTVTGNTAVVVKLFRVFLLLPTVLCVGAYFAHLGMKHGEARVPVPLFAVVFVALGIVNSFVPGIAAAATDYAMVKNVIVEGSNWGLLVAIAALGLNTSVRAIVELGWRHVAAAMGTTLVILVIVTAGLVLAR